MTKRKKIAVIFCPVLVGIVAVLVLVVPWAYSKLDAGYQVAMDPIRIDDGKAIAALMFEYEKKSGFLPFEREAQGKPFMVLIGRSSEEEDFYATQDVLRRGATFANSKDLESELERVLGRKVFLPRDPQKVATYAPNVYVYFLSGKQFTVAVHLFEPSASSVEYEWKGGVFHSHARSYAKKMGD